jgi:PAS domain S-box-containing protein
MLDSSSELAFGPVFETVDIGLVLLDRQACIVAWNAWMARVSRQPAEEVLGKSFFDVFPAARETRLPNVIEDSFRAGSSSILTHALNEPLPLRGDDGEPLLHNTVVRPVSSSHTTYCLLQITDVTVSVTRERVLRERQNARYHAIVDSSPDAIITINQDRTIQWLNTAVNRVLGYNQSDLLGQKLDILLEPDNKLLPTLTSASPKRRVEGAIPVLGRHKNGKTGYFDVSVGHWTADQHDFVTTIWRDVTERISADAALRDARDALEKSNEELEARIEDRTREREAALRQLHESQKMESIGQLTGGVAHDFNNLLAIILGSLALLKKAIPDEPRVARLLDRAIQGAERGASLTTRLLAFARRQELRVEVIELQKLFPGMLDFLRHSVGPNIAIDVEISPDVAPVEVDANQLELALINLAVNARDAMPQGGSLKISSRNETDGKQLGLPQEDYVSISVTDIGEGMSQETLAKAQEPFFTTKGIGKGTGLGLSMVQGFAAQSGGTMRIKSELGRGTVVTIWLPSSKKSVTDVASMSEAKLAEASETGSLRVLLVDDDLLVSMGAADMLLDLGHSVIEAGSAKQALTLLESDAEFDVVVTDYAMPGMSGLELAHCIKAKHPKMPIILATGYAELPAGRVNEFRRLSKPYTENELATALEMVLKARN